MKIYNLDEGTITNLFMPIDKEFRRVVSEIQVVAKSLVKKLNKEAPANGDPEKRNQLIVSYSMKINRALKSKIIEINPKILSVSIPVLSTVKNLMGNIDTQSGIINTKIRRYRGKLEFVFPIWTGLMLMFSPNAAANSLIDSASSEFKRIRRDLRQGVEPFDYD